MKLLELIGLGIQKKSSDIHIASGRPVSFRIDGELTAIDDYILSAEDIKSIVYDIIGDELMETLDSKGEIDFAYSSPNLRRYRGNIFKQNTGYGMVLRIIPLEIPSAESLGLPIVVRELTRLRRGLILVTGPAGSGKSTTLASMIDMINEEKSCHILTLEDPIEYIHKHKKALINQREIGRDTKNFKTGLRAGLRQDPDVILVGEMRDLETISTVLTAAETGHLVISTLHTLGASKSIDRIIDIFPPYQQDQIRVQLSTVLEAVISQQLLPKANGDGRIGAYEVMVATPAIRNLIRDGKIYQIDTCIQTGKSNRMQTMDSHIAELLKNGYITKDVALDYSINKEQIRKYIL